MPAGVAPMSSARCDASWIVRPSITGSENGIPISIASAPAAATARTTSSQAAPRPPVTYGTSSFFPESRFARSVSSSLTSAPPLGPAPASALRTRSGLRSRERLPGEALGDLHRILVTAPGKGQQDRRAAWDGAPDLPGQVPERVGRLERGDDPLGPAQHLEALERLVVAGRSVGRPARGRQRGVLGPDARVVEAGADRVGLEDL